MVTIYEDKGEVIEDRLGEAPKTRLRVVPGYRQSVGISDGLSPFIHNFLQIFEGILKNKRDTTEPTIKVSELLGKLARLYERVRNVVEYKGENVLRRNAIERILKRLVWEQEASLNPKGLEPFSVNTLRVSETLIKELIRARYLPNNVIPTGKIQEVEKVLKKYIYLLQHLPNLPMNLKLSAIREWIWGVASAEIEDLVDPSNRELYVALMYEWFITYFDWNDVGLSEEQKKLQIYLAIHRAYPKSDDPILRYNLLLKKFTNWQNVNEEQIDKFINSFVRIYKEIENELNFEGKYIIFRKIQRHVAAFDIFRKIATDEKIFLRSLLLDESHLVEKIREVCGEKYGQIRARVNTGIVRSIIYIFITKVLLALVIEVPYEIYRFGDIRYLPLTLNIIFPPIAMWMIGFSIKVPGEKNTQEIIKRLKSVVYKNELSEKRTFSIRQSKGRSTLAQIFTILYSATFVLVFGGIAYLLLKINFTFLGIVIFFGFMSLVLLFAFRVKYSAEQLKAEADEEGLFEHLFSYLSLPFLNFGFYLSKGLAKLNFLTILLDFLIEAPLKSIIEIFEEWTSFLRQKKEEVVEIPE